jgi:hypothetical protein
MMDTHDEPKTITITLGEALLLRDMNRAGAGKAVGLWGHARRESDLFRIVVRWLCSLVARAKWGVQPETHGRVFVRRFAPRIGSAETICAVLVDGIEVFRTEPRDDDVDDDGHAMSTRRFSGEFPDIAEQIAARKARKASGERRRANEDYERHLDMAAADLRTMGLHWSPGQEGGVVYCRDGFRVSARGALRRCGLSKDAAEALLNDAHTALYAEWDPTRCYDFHLWLERRGVMLTDRGILKNAPSGKPDPQARRRAHRHDRWLDVELAAHGMAA